MSTMSKVEAAVKRLAAVRAALEEAKQEKHRVQTEIENLVADFGLDEQLDQVNASLLTLRGEEHNERDELDTVALTCFDLTGEKHPHPAVTITEGKSATILDSGAVVEYLIKTDQLHLLTPDKQAVLKLVKAGLNIPGTSLEESLGTRVKSDLTEYTPVEAVEPEPEVLEIPF